MKIPEHLLPFLSKLTKELEKILNDSLVGIYLHGSLTYGGYVKERSDIDVLVLLNNEIVPEMRSQLDSLLAEISKIYSEEIKNTELDMLLLSEIKKKPGVLHSQYTFMDNEPKGPEALNGFWIELANTRRNGIVLSGPDPKEVITNIDQDILIEANKQKFVDLQKNAEKWEKIDLWNQVFILVQASRALYSLKNDLKLASKQDALVWAVKNAPEQFIEMLKVAQSKLDNFEGSRVKVISENWHGYLKYVEGQFKN